MTEEKPKHVFDKKYKTIVNVKSTAAYTEMLDWLDANSHGSVNVIFEITKYPDPVIISIAFENSDDALIFKIKYSA